MTQLVIKRYHIEEFTSETGVWTELVSAEVSNFHCAFMRRLYDYYRQRLANRQYWCKYDDLYLLKIVETKTGRIIAVSRSTK